VIVAAGLAAAITHQGLVTVDNDAVGRSDEYRGFHPS